MIELETPQQPQPGPLPAHRRGAGGGQPEPLRGDPAPGGLRHDAGQRPASRPAQLPRGRGCHQHPDPGVFHEFSTIENVKEDVTQIVLNVKKLRLRSFARHPVTLKLVKRGAGPVTAGDISESADVEIVNPELVLLTLDSDSGLDRDGPHHRDRRGLPPGRAHRGDADRGRPGRRALLPDPPGELPGREDPRRPDDELRQAVARDRDRRNDDRRRRRSARRPTSSSASSAGSPRSAGRRSRPAMPLRRRRARTCSTRRSRSSTSRCGPTTA